MYKNIKEVFHLVIKATVCLNVLSNYTETYKHRYVQSTNIITFTFHKERTVTTLNALTICKISCCSVAETLYF